MSDARKPKPVKGWAIVKGSKVTTYDFADDRTFWIFTNRRRAYAGCAEGERVVRVLIVPEESNA